MNKYLSLIQDTSLLTNHTRLHIKYNNASNTCNNIYVKPYGAIYKLLGKYKKIIIIIMNPIINIDSENTQLTDF